MTQSATEVPTSALAGALSEFLAQLAVATGDNTLHSGQVQLLLALYLNPDINQLDLSRWTRIERSANSRNLAKLGQGERPTIHKGPGLVESYEDPLDRRFKRARLTPKGKAMVEAALKRAGQMIAARARS